MIHLGDFLRWWTDTKDVVPVNAAGDSFAPDRGASQLVAIAALSHENVAEPQCVTFQVGPPNGDVLDDREVEVTSLHIGNPKVWHFAIPPALQVHAIRRWWRTVAKKRHPRVKRLLITADGGGSNGYRVRLWKVELQKLADVLKVPITVCHLPSDTGKWNKIEHASFHLSRSIGAENPRAATVQSSN